MKIQVISPDGFPIDSKIYPNFAAALIGYWSWEKNYKIQGYYSSRDFGKIKLVDLIDFCQFVEIDTTAKNA
jgi:hypothetical protein